MLSNFFLARLLLAVAALGFCATTGVQAAAGGAKVIRHTGHTVHAPQLLAARQQASTTSPRCLEYSRVANMSTIGANLTYSAPFLQASTTGTRSNLDMFFAAAEDLPDMTTNAGLNEECGNLTTIALEGAERNFTQGIVGQFSELPNNPLKSEIEVVLSVIACCILVGVPALFMTE